ncbi:phage tail protein [Sandarakinorhabdus sp. DWP1-3-1]|uniref:phage tail protein n=1 Tax=Sandarakinorhabdus sp. DWP1-3-1 TaxID=2804627 RepID=UPI003CE90A88
MPINGPWGAFNFVVEIDGIDEAGFAEVSGLSFETELIRYRNGNDKANSVRSLPGLHKVGDVTLKRGLVASTSFYQWLRGIADGQDDVRNVVIVLHDETHQPVKRFKLTRARIIKHVSGPLNAAANQVAMEEIVLAHERLEIE